MVEVRVFRNRASKLGAILSKLGLEAVLALEDLDPQRVAVLAIREKAGSWAPVYTLLLALVSYKLSIRGEEWWRSYAEFLSQRRSPESLSDVVNDVIEFVKSSRGASIKREEKIKRIEKAYRNSKVLLEVLYSDNDIIYTRAGEILQDLAKSLGVPEDSKTLVFAIKMAYYATRRPGDFATVSGIDVIPVDLRVACISYSSFLVDADSYRTLLKERKAVSKAWSLVSKTSGIPLIHLDSLLWLTGWAPRDLSLEKARDVVSETLSRVVSRELAENVARELCLRKCR
ncbi:MAG: N-glycosylase/DNA lyase [Acidilobaceae archaeon]